MSFNASKPEFLTSTLQTSHCHRQWTPRHPVTIDFWLCVTAAGGAFIHLPQGWSQLTRCQTPPCAAMGESLSDAAGVCQPAALRRKQTGRLDADVRSGGGGGGAKQVAWRWSPPTASSMLWVTNQEAALIPSLVHTSVCMCITSVFAVKAGHGSISCVANRQRLGLD